MMHKAWCSTEEVPYCFSRSSVIFQGHTEQKIANFYLNWVFPDCNSSLKFTNGFEMMHKAWHDIKEVSYCFFKVIHQIQGHGLKNWWFESNLSKITRPVGAIKSLRFALFKVKFWKSDLRNHFRCYFCVCQQFFCPSYVMIRSYALAGWH